jgi:predicted adenylyl cyclase CyaB
MVYHAFGKKIQGILYGQETRNSPVLRINLIIVRRARMPRNIEIKARIESVAALALKAAALADEGPLEFTQDDTFFHCEAGRLKLRAFSESHGELIFYRRMDQAAPKESFYIISETRHPGSLRQALSLAYGQIGHLRKQRTLYWVGRTRIHLDVVEGLGQFVEIEVVLGPDETAQAGSEIAHRVMAALGICESQLVAGAYIDLIEASRA